MSMLFIVEGGRAKPNTETLLIHPFNKIWDRDEHPDKLEAIKDFTFIEFMVSKKKSNPYAGYSEDVRFEKLVEQIYDDPDWEPDLLIEEGMAYLVEFQTNASPIYSFYMSALLASEKLKDFLNNFDINEKTERGMPIYKPSDITRAIVDTEKVLTNLQSLKNKVEQELFETTKTRGAKIINHFEQ